MADRPPPDAPPDVTSRTREPIQAYKPRWGFFKGMLTGAAVEIPALTLVIWLIARAGIGNRSASFVAMLQLATKFAGVAALLTAGGIGRLAADASLDGGRRRAIWVAARAHAAAGIGLAVIATIPNGHLPAGAQWIAIAIGGAIAGAGCGALIGLVCSGAAPVELSDVWRLASAPTDALRTILNAEQLGRLGSAVKSRTSHLFEGIFDPAPKAPEQPEEPPEEKKPE